MSQRIALFVMVLVGLGLGGSARAAEAPTPQTKRKPKIYVAFHWHMHQPIYWPYESITETANNPDSTDAVLEYLSWPDRVGAYTHYPIDTIANHKGQPHVGAQISFSGSLIENIQDMANHGIAYGQGWQNRYREGIGWRTSLGNPRIDMVAFGYHHPLMALCDYQDTRRSIADHRKILLETFGGQPSKGIFPPENAFSERMIPALVDEGIEWALVDNIHFDRANKGYPWTPQQKIPPPNRASQRNPAQPHYEALSCQQNTTNNVSTGFGLRPHWARYVDPATGEAVTPEGKPARMIVVPTERSIGYDDSYGDRSPIPRLQQLEPFNDDPEHPFLVVLAHDGDNAGASGSRYYLETCGWIGQNPDKYELTTIQDYLTMFPPDQGDVIHVEDGSWTGADLGDQEFKKWNGDPYAAGQVDHEEGYSPDRNSWAAITAAKNRVLTADRIAPGTPDAEEAWRQFLVGTTSCYWYWDGTFEWDLKPTIAANNAVAFTDKILVGDFQDQVPPTLYIPQREPYNPGAVESEKVIAAEERGWTPLAPWTAVYPGGRLVSQPMPSDFTVWTLAYDVSGLESVTLEYRVHESPEVGPENMVYEGGDWLSLPMGGKPIPDVSPDLTAKYKAEQFSAEVSGIQERLVDYYVRAVDGRGNVARSPIQHVWVGKKVSIPDLVSPENPTVADVLTIRAPRPGFLHWGVNGWTLPDAAYHPPGTTLWGDGKAVDTPLEGPDETGGYLVRVGPFQGVQEVEELNFVFHFEDDTWSGDHVLPLEGVETLRSSRDYSEALLRVDRAARRFVFADREQRPDMESAREQWSEVLDRTRKLLSRSRPEDGERFLRLLGKLAARDHGPLGDLLRREFPAP